MAKTANPFADYDFAKNWGEFKMPAFDVEAFVTLQQRNLEAVTAANKLAVEGFQAAAQRQAEIVRATFEKTTDAAQEYVKLADTEDKLAYQAKYAKAAVQSGVENAREISGIFGKATAEAVDVVTKRVVEGFDEFEGIVAKAAKAANGAKAQTKTAAK